MIAALNANSGQGLEIGHVSFIVLSLLLNRKQVLTQNLKQGRRVFMGNEQTERKAQSKV